MCMQHSIPHLLFLVSISNFRSTYKPPAEAYRRFIASPCQRLRLLNASIKWNMSSQILDIHDVRHDSSGACMWCVVSQGISAQPQLHPIPIKNVFISDKSLVHLQRAYSTNNVSSSRILSGFWYEEYFVHILTLNVTLRVGADSI